MSPLLQPSGWLAVRMFILLLIMSPLLLHVEGVS